ncbi:hypothetical protein FD755_021478, partial [Muntiacus reevesi]
AIFLLEIKMGRKAAETTCNIDNAFGQGTANECTVLWWFKKSVSDLPSEVDNGKLRAIFKADPLTTTWEVAEKLNIDHSMVTQHLKHIGKVKKLGKWVPPEQLQIKKKSSKNNDQFLDWTVTSNEKWILYDNRGQPAQWLDQEAAPKHFPKLNLPPKKVTVTVWWFAARLIHNCFLNPGEPITSEKHAQQINVKHRKLHHVQLATVNRKGPILHDSLKELDYEVLPHPPYPPDLLPTSYHFFKHFNNFLQGKHFHTHQEAENAFQDLIDSQRTDFYATGISKLISCWQNCVDCNGSYFD